MASAFDLTATARSLLNIEVNTIVRDNMTGEPMPPAPHALLDIAGEYAAVLCELGIDLPSYFRQGAGDPAAIIPAWLDAPTSVSDDLTVSADTFDRLRWAAKWASTTQTPLAARITPSEGVLLGRIINNSDAIKEMFKRFDPSMQPFVGKTRAQLLETPLQPSSYVIAPDDLIRLQKMWDIGVEEIVAQTVVHVTGDVTTRVQEALRSPGSETVFAIHRQSIDVSVACWKYMLDAVREIAGAAIRVVLRGGA